VVDEATVQAAGVVMLRDGPYGTEVLAVHRPHRVDWSLPKGKLDPGEHVVVAAVRECDEETGLVPVLGPPLERRTYLSLGRSKTVDYWAARPGTDEGFTPDEEIDEIRWIPAWQTASLLTYARDVELVERALMLPQTSPLIVLRHAQALKRHDFHGHVDARRPLTGRGRSQAKQLVPLLSAYGVTVVHSSDSVRCHETVRRYAESVQVPVLHEPSMSEEGHEKRPKAARKRILALAMEPQPMVVCSHRPVLPALLDALGDLDGADPDDPLLDPKLPPAGFVVLHRAFDEDGSLRVVAAERHTL
jgi:8-oxo-(d)GTP phosphatase